MAYCSMVAPFNERATINLSQVLRFSVFRRLWLPRAARLGNCTLVRRSDITRRETSSTPDAQPQETSSNNGKK